MWRLQFILEANRKNKNNIMWHSTKGERKGEEENEEKEEANGNGSGMGLPLNRNSGSVQRERRWAAGWSKRLGGSSHTQYF